MTGMRDKMKVNSSQLDCLLKRSADALHLVGVGGAVASIFDDTPVGFLGLSVLFFITSCCVDLWRTK